MSLRHLIVATASVLCLLGIISAQEPAIQNADSGLALEVTFLQDTAPAYQTVTRTEAPKGGHGMRVLAGWPDGDCHQDTNQSGLSG